VFQSGERREAAVTHVVPRQREIIDRRALAAALAAAAAKDGPADALRRRALALLKEHLDRGRTEVRRRFEAGATGAATVRAQSFLMDQLLRVLYDFTLHYVYHRPNPTAGERLCLVALGGYGRGELAPFSDVDLLFLRAYKTTPLVEQVVESILYILWDLGLKVGHATRTGDECIRLAESDVTIRTALLEARYLWGERSLYDELRTRFDAEVMARSGPEFVEAKLAESAQRHQRLGDSRYLVEPNLKEGKGGLRDLQTLFWIAKYLYRVDTVDALVERGVFIDEDARRFADALEFLWTVRCHLHYLAGRAEERLTFDVQAEIGRRMGYTDHAGTRGVERFMKHYFLVAKTVGDLARIEIAALEAQHKRKPRFRLVGVSPRRRRLEGFVIEGNRLTIAKPTAFAEKPIDAIRLFEVAQRHDLDIHPNALKRLRYAIKRIDAGLRADPEANRLFMAMLTSRKDPEKTLRRLNESGVFGRFIPDFGRIVAQMQYDMYHVFTVDEHTIAAIGMLHRMEAGKLVKDHPTETKVLKRIKARDVLYVALLLHDIAKGRGGDHSEIGAQVAKRLCPRLGLSREDTALVAWLVRHHLAMSMTAQKRDLNEMKTIGDFAGLVETPERLRLLFVLTVCDMRATGPNVWTAWKAALLRELYLATEERLSGSAVSAGRQTRIADALAGARAQLGDWDDGTFTAYAQRHYPVYWLSFDGETIARHARLVREADREKRPLTVDQRTDPARGVTEVTVYTADHPGLFSRIAGAMAVGGANIVDARIFTTVDGMALDSFSVQSLGGEAIARPDKRARLATAIERTLQGEVKPHRVLAKPPPIPSRTRIFTVTPSVAIDNNASATHSVIEIVARDRPGLLHDVTACVTALGLQISTAKISTFGERAVDTFYVKDVFGVQITNKAKLAQIQERLMAVLADPNKPTVESPAKPIRVRAARASAARRARRNNGAVSTRS